MSVEVNAKTEPAGTTGSTTDVNPAEGLHDMHSGRPAASIGSWLETSLSHAEPHIQDGIDAARFVWNNPGDALSGAAAGLGEFASDAWGDAVDRAVLIGGPLVMGEDRWNEAAGNQLLNGAEYVGDMNQEADELLAAYDQDGLAGLSGELIGRYGAEVSSAAAGGPLGGKLGSVIKGVSMTAKGQKLKKLVDKALDKLKKAKKKGKASGETDKGAFVGKPGGNGPDNEIDAKSGLTNRQKTEGARALWGDKKIAELEAKGYREIPALDRGAYSRVFVSADGQTYAKIPQRSYYDPYEYSRQTVEQIDILSSDPDYGHLLPRTWADDGVIFQDAAAGNNFRDAFSYVESKAQYNMDSAQLIAPIDEHFRGRYPSMTIDTNAHNFTYDSQGNPLVWFDPVMPD